jgi:hypothetical protein
MNIWKLTSTNDIRVLQAVIIALTPKEAASMLIDQGGITISETMTCKQLGSAASNFRSPEIVSIVKTML